MNPRLIGGPKEGEPGETIFVAVTDVLPPQMFMATVQDDGYFAEELYDALDAARLAAEHRDG